ncbi:DUF86 domain-containing protein [Candidatus Sumerlaeota bacterium]|nr:DUF86 domain-containing protein [Candidatus Sumerlaeota bacterium]
MSERTDRDFLDDIEQAAQRIKAYLAGITYESFSADTKTQDAIIRNLEIAGEATKNLSEKLRAQYPHISWKQMAGVRDRLIHHYFGVNLDIVWQIAADEIPTLLSQLAEIRGDKAR